MLFNLLSNAIRQARNILVSGSSTKKHDLEKTANWNLFSWWRGYSYSKYIKNEENKWKLYKSTQTRRIHPTQMVDIDLTDQYDAFSELLSAFIVSNQLRMGNCGDHSAQVYCFLWQMANRYGRASGIKRLEILSFDELDHQLVIVNRNVNSDPNKPSTWGWRDCRIIDAWWEEGKILIGNEFFKKFNELLDYCQLQHKYINQLLNLSDNVEKSSSFTLLYDLKPCTLKFPDNIEQLITFDPLDFDLSLVELDLKDDRREHQEAFTPTLDAIKERTHFKSMTLGSKSEQPPFSKTARSNQSCPNHKCNNT